MFWQTTGSFINAFVFNIEKPIEYANYAMNITTYLESTF